MIMSTNFKKS